jgi:hypothetical protein
MSHRRAALYLQIPDAYCRSFGGLRWAQYGEAVEFLGGPDAGRTFAFAAEIARFLEGLLTPGQSFLAFGCVLHMLYLIGLGERAQGHDSIHRLRRINEPFRDLRSPLRNAGALCAWLCREIPGVADPPDLSHVQDLLNGGSWVPQMVLSHPMLGAMDYAEQPALGPPDFQARIVSELDTLSDEAVRHWLKHGRGPLEAIDDRLVPFPPRGLAGWLSEMERRPRLAGVTGVISRLEGALSLPPRRLDRSELQTDGYSDLATRGSPERILPIQFALEDEEFLRRFAGRELLYFHRETPHQPAVEEVVLLLDQGVRTWGDIRLVLAGAAVALARQAQRRRIAIRLATTGNGGEPVDPARLDRGALAELLEASDLSPHPGLMLARLLRSDALARRDVVLLTHPRSLGEPEVADAARQIAEGAGTRLFAVSVDSGGEVELTELRHGWPVKLGRSRVDLGTLAGPARPAPAVARLAQPKPWAGELDPIPFPFRSGILDRISTVHGEVCRHIDFDESGERILVAGRHGLLFTSAIDGDDAEILPRPIIDGEVMRPVRTVIGVAGGFVLVGNRKGGPVLAHYDFPSRTCTIHGLDQWESPTSRSSVGGGATGASVESAISWFYYADLHAIAGLPAEAGQPCIGIDLALHSARRTDGAETPVSSRAVRAAERARAGLSPYPLPAAQLSTSPSDPWADLSCRAVRLDAKTGTLEYRQGSGQLKSLVPLSDGRPALKGARIACTRQGGDILAIRLHGTPSAEIMFISIYRADVVGTLSNQGDTPSDSSFALSRDGRRFARRLNDQQVEVREVPGDRPPVLVSAREDVWIHFASLGRSCLLVREFDLGGPRRPHSMCLIRWDRGQLEVDHRDPARIFQELGGVVAESRSLAPLKSGSYRDCVRFLQVVEHDRGLRILIDQYNQLAVLGRDGELIGMFYVSGNEFAAWMPEGTRLGSSRLIGSEPTPGAAEQMAAVLRSAERGEGRSP